MHKIYTSAYVHTPISICVFRHRHTIYTEAEAPTCFSTSPNIRNIEYSYFFCRARSGPVKEKGEEFSLTCRHRGCSHRDDRVWHMGVAKWCSAYSISSVPNVLFNNLSEDESLLLFFNTKHACHFSTAISLKVLLTAGAITAISHSLQPVCLSGLTTAGALQLSLDLPFYCDFPCPSFLPLSPAFFIYLYILPFLSLFPFVYNAVLALTHSFFLPTLPGCSFDLCLSCFIWRPTKEGASGPLCMEPGSSTRASEPAVLHTMQQGAQNRKITASSSRRASSKAAVKHGEPRAWPQRRQANKPAQE